MFIFHNIILPKLLDIIEVIDTTSIAKHNNRKKKIKFITTKGEEFSRKLSKFTKDKPLHKFKDIKLSLEVF